MGFDINGVWTSNFYPIQDKDAGIAILASKFQTLIQTDIKSGFNNCITRDGSGKPTANLNLNGHKIINLASGVNGTDAVTKSQMDTAIAEGQSGAIASSLKLFEFKWFDHLLEDMSWLRADTFSWQDGTVYTNAYNHLVDDIDGVSSSTETIAGTTITYYQATDGHKIVLADQETTAANIYSESGVAWYYILDTANTRFKLPRTKFGFTGLRNAVGKYVAESLPNLKGTLSHVGDIATGVFKNSSSTTNVNAHSSQAIPIADFDASQYSSVYQDDAPVQQRATQMYLYFYVGNFSQSATEQTAGLNSELFNTKVDLDGSNATFPHIVETYSNGTDWYRVWSDGWCEQGGYSSGGTVTFLKEMTDTNYTITFGDYRNGADTSGDFRYVTAFSTTGFTKAVDTNGSFWWKAEGYILQE